MTDVVIWLIFLIATLLGIVCALIDNRGFLKKKPPLMEAMTDNDIEVSEAFKNLKLTNSFYENNKK